MNKRIIKLIFIIFIAIIFIYGFSSSYKSKSIDNITYVIALGVDVDDNDTLKVTFEFMDTSAFSSSGDSQSSSSILNTVTSTSIDSAINLMNTYSSKELNLSHCKIVVFSDEVAAQGLLDKTSELINNAQVRPTTNIIISKGTAYDYLDNSSSSLDKILTKYFDVLPESAEYTGYTSDITLGQFYDTLIESNSGSTAILGGVTNDSSDTFSPSEIIAGNSSIESKRKSENIGLAVFNEDKYIGDLTALETQCHCIITNEVDSFLISVNYPTEDNLLDISLSPEKSTKVNVSTDNDTLTINIDIYLTGRILSVYDDADYSNEETLNDISNCVTQYMTNTMVDYLNKTSRTFGCDIDEFFKYGKQNFLYLEDWNNFDWKTKYQNANFNVNITSNVISSLLVSEG